MVGRALAKVLDNPILYDPTRGIGGLIELNREEEVCICGTTTFEKRWDLSLVREV